MKELVIMLTAGALSFALFVLFLYILDIYRNKNDKYYNDDEPDII